MTVRARQETKVTRELLREWPGVVNVVDLPPVPWIVRGPRGGHYLATGARERSVGEIGDDFMQNTVTVSDRSEGVRYLRPAQARRLVPQ